MSKRSGWATALPFVVLMAACSAPDSGVSTSTTESQSATAESPEYFLLRPEVEQAYGYTHAIKIGDDIKVSGAVSMDAHGNPTAVGNLEQQMKNAYSDLGEVLAHYGYTFGDVIVENIFTTDMAGFLEVAGYRTSIYAERFPTGTWLEVKGLALPEFMIEIELEAHRSGHDRQAELTEFATDYAAAWSGQAPEELASFYAEDGSLTVNAGAPSVGQSAIAATAGAYMAAFPDMEVKMDSVKQAGNRVTFFWTWTGTNSGPGGTGRSVHLSGYEEWTLNADGRIAESKGHFDDAEYMRQLEGEG